jgi:cation diffusion facilitator CzcD-associated flavoprotein CzcO
LFPPREELFHYFERVWREFGLDTRTMLESTVTGCEWVEKEHQWRVTISNTKGELQVMAKTVIAATGVFSQPKSLELPGKELFQGRYFHSARWDHSIDLRDKCVVVIGNGCSATQFVPVSAEQAKSVVQIARSSHHIDRPIANNRGHSFLFRFLRKYVPGFALMVRIFWYLLLDFDFLVFIKKFPLVRKIHQFVSNWYTKRYSPSKYTSMLIPSYEYGQKRRVFDADYLACLHRDNMILKKGTLEGYYERGVLVDGEKVAADVVIAANGFEVQQFLGNLNVKGVMETIRSKWDRMGRPRAYQGGVLAGFPNFMILMGPNTLTGHHSVIFATECMTDYAIKLFHPIYTNSLSRIELKQEEEDRYQLWIDKKMKSLIWEPNGVGGWYQNHAGNSMIFPSFQTHFWYLNSWVKWHHFHTM